MLMHVGNHLDVDDHLVSIVSTIGDLAQILSITALRRNDVRWDTAAIVTLCFVKCELCPAKHICLHTYIGNKIWKYQFRHSYFRFSAKLRQPWWSNFFLFYFYFDGMKIKQIFIFEISFTVSKLFKNAKKII